MMLSKLMRWFPRMRSLHGRLLSLLLSMMLVVWLVAALLTWSSASHELDELLDGHLAQSAALLVAQQTGHGEDEMHAEDVTQDAPDMLHKYAPRVAFQVFHEGKLTLHSSNAGTVPMARVLRGFETVTRADGLVWRIFAARGSEGDVQVYVGEQVTSRDSILWAVLQSLLTPLLLALPVLGVFGWLMVRQALRPLRALGQALASRQPQVMEAIALDDVPSEMEPVLQALNQLLGRISHMLAAERRFTADAAHELRTPIAAIRMQAQVALGAGDDDTPGRTRALQQTLAGCDRATHLVEQLLTLSRLESSSSGAPAGHVNLSALAQRMAADLAPTALQRSQTLTLDAAQPALIAVDETLTGVLLRNLLDNALRYSPANAMVSVRVGLTPDLQAWLQVDDSGPGLPEADLVRLGERFFRVLGTGQSGSGLGWSIVRRIALVYQAQVTVQRSTALGGLSVRVVWPTAPTAVH
jgi:two-component system sensor histidine kinase QseC